MKILLFYPPGIALPGEIYFEAPPLGLVYLAAVLEKAGHRVKIIDALVEDQEIINRGDGYQNIGMPWDKAKRRIEDFQPDLVGISNLFSIQYDNVRRIAALTKEVGGIHIVVGGAHPSAMPEEVLKDENIDFVIIGEGEHAFLELVKCLENNLPHYNIDGLAFKKNNQITVNPKKNYIKNLDDLPFPARHLLPMEKYFNTQNIHAYYVRNKPYTTVITSRGCPGRCTFCSIHTVWGWQFRARSPKNVVDEIELLVKQYGIKEIHFEDDNITLNRQRMMQICQEIIDRGLKISWVTPNGVAIQTLDEELLIKMKESGCYHLFLGIESGNEHVLHKLIKKGLDLNKAKKIMPILKKLKIKSSAFFVFGVPGETEGTIKDSIKLAKNLDFDDVWFSLATPYPGTELYKIAIKEGYLRDFNLTSFRPKLSLISTPWLSSNDLEKLRNKAYFEFQFHKFLRHPLTYLLIKENYSTLLRYAKYYFSSLSHKLINNK